MLQSIYFEYIEETFEVVSDGTIDVNRVMDLLVPAFPIVAEPTGRVTCRVQLNVSDLDKSWINEEKPWRMPPMLEVDFEIGGGLRILSYSEEHKSIFRESEPDCAELQLDVTQDNRLWALTVAEPSISGMRAIARVIKQLVGHCVTRKKAKIFHASCALINGRSYVFYGNRGAGKSSFMFRSCVDLKAKFKSDDQLICWIDSQGKVQLSGWPRRMGISLSAFNSDSDTQLNYFELRRRQPLGSDWQKDIGQHYPPQERKRLMFDMDEFMSVFDVEFSYDCTPIQFVRVNYKDTSPDALMVERLDSVCEETVYSNPNVLRHFVDYLSLGPTPLKSSSPVTFEGVSGENNRHRLDYGANFFDNFKDSWQAAESQMIGSIT